MQLVLMSRQEPNTEAKITRKATKEKLEIFNITSVSGRDFKRKTERDEVERVDRYSREE